MNPDLPFKTRIKLSILAIAGKNRHILNLMDTKAPAPTTKRINSTTTVSTSDITMDRSRNLWFRLFVPKCTNNTKLPLIVYIHGGGFTRYGPDSKIFDDLCSHLAAEAPAVIASINYRLTPEYKYPIQYEDSFDALKFIDSQNYAVLPSNTDLSNCFIAGDSAGGNIAHHVTFRIFQNIGEFSNVKFRGLVSLMPFFGGEDRTESELRLINVPVINLEGTDQAWKCFLPEGDDRNHYAAHVFGNDEITEDIKRIEQFPRVLVVIGGYDPLKDWQRKYVEWLENCGKEVEVVEYPNAFHGVYVFPEVPEYGLIIKDVTNFIKRTIGIDN